jgi:colicin import membrane protein
MRKLLGISLGLHLAIMFALSLTFTSSIKVAPSAPIQVRLVGVPQPSAPTAQPNKPEPVRTQDSTAPKDPPPEVKNIPPSEAKTKFLQNIEKFLKDEQPNPIEAQKRPPVLDKNPDKKKVVKNDLNAKVVKNPEDFMESLDAFVDKSNKAVPSKPANVPATPDKPAGEGPEIQLNAADMGIVDAIRSHIEKNWLLPPGKDLRGLQVTVMVSIAPDGNVTDLHVSRGSGDASFDNSLLRAVRKAVPLPIPGDKYDKFKDLELSFAPGG